jgi:predicted ATPase
VDANDTLKNAVDIGQAATLMITLQFTSLTHVLCGNYSAATSQCNELIILTNKKDSLYRKALGMNHEGCVLALTGQASEAIHMITSGITVARSIGAKIWMPLWLSHLASAHAELGQFDDAWRCIGEAITTVKATKERWCEAEVHRLAGEIALMSPQQPGKGEAEAYFELALSVARDQQAKSWELRAAMSVARLLRDQGQGGTARELLAPVYAWFTEGFDTLDLRNAKALLDELAS